MTLGPVQGDKREFGRRWSRVHGWICVEGRPRVACTVRNYSDGGAFLLFDPGYNPPDLFRLVVEAADLTIGCEVRHRHDGSAGVRFLPEAILQRLLASLDTATTQEASNDAIDDAPPSDPFSAPASVGGITPASADTSDLAAAIALWNAAPPSSPSGDGQAGPVIRANMSRVAARTAPELNRGGLAMPSLAEPHPHRISTPVASSWTLARG